ncbi:carbohydrate kinase family protein [Uliginosibacterium gangwonense]|uniref:carbohydrate kinase family protein n=1 Tax=Uliginosibacterium gangwonense TaxID=392736 RepID=UPI000379A04D|nr:carbohydrate kinase family protein [Uliginosibacterium gangwonense]
MSALICGSMAYDTIMVFHSQFKRHILPEQLHILNVSFVVPDMRRDFGGCAGNIAYALKLLGGEPLIMATMGEDAAPYLAHLDKLGISTRHIRVINGSYTAQAFITTDLDDNQITAFHPGAMSFSHQNLVRDAAHEIRVAIVSPDGKQGMMQHVHGLAAAGVPFVFDPGQGLPMLSAEEVQECLDLCRYCTVNDYEARLMCDKTGLSIEQIAERAGTLVVTLGGEGSRIYAQGKTIDIPCAQATNLADPTGCGDAYRGGLLYGLLQGWDIEQSARLASVMGAIKIAHRGGQNYTASREDIATLYASTFGAKPW